MGLSIAIAGIIVLLSFVSVLYAARQDKKIQVMMKKKEQQVKSAADAGAYSSNDVQQVKYDAERASNGHNQGYGNDAQRQPRDNYSQNFV
ncbi:hypothetical protein PRNP1_012397 [Phytophthora ramorum]